MTKPYIDFVEFRDLKNVCFLNDLFKFISKAAFEDSSNKNYFVLYSKLFLNICSTNTFRIRKAK